MKTYLVMESEIYKNHGVKGHVYRQFDSLAEAKNFTRNYPENSGRAANLYIVEVEHKPIFEITSTFTVTTKDL